MGRRLSESLAGHNTGWCTAGETTATEQLQHGDFYTYYTYDDKGKPTIPRLAIRMENGQVSYDVRGILPGQDVEPSFADILSEKLETLPGGEEYVQKAADMKLVTAIEKRLKKDPDTVLSAKEISVLYELDHPVVGFGYDGHDPRITELRKARGERDHAELGKVLVEVLMQQAQAAYDAYHDTAVKLGASEIMTEADFAELLERKEAEWRENGVYDHLVKELIENGSRPNLVATPNILADYQQIRELASEMTDGDIYADDEFLEGYNAEELSGTPEGGLVRLSIIPSSYNMRAADVETQRRELAALQEKEPALGHHIASMLENVLNWRTMKARGIDIAHWRLTDTRHIDLPVRVDFVPDSVVDGRGYARLRGFAAWNEYGGRRSVG